MDIEALTPKQLMSMQKRLRRYGLRLLVYSVVVFFAVVYGYISSNGAAGALLGVAVGFVVGNGNRAQAKRAALQLLRKEELESLMARAADARHAAERSLDCLAMLDVSAARKNMYASIEMQHTLAHALMVQHAVSISGD